MFSIIDARGEQGSSVLQQCNTLKLAVEAALDLIRSGYDNESLVIPVIANAGMDGVVVFSEAAEAAQWQRADQLGIVAFDSYRLSAEGPLVTSWRYQLPSAEIKRGQVTFEPPCVDEVLRHLRSPIMSRRRA